MLSIALSIFYVRILSHTVYASQKQTCNNTRNTSIPPEVLSFQVVFVNKFNLMEDILLLVLWPVKEELVLISCGFNIMWVQEDQDHRTRCSGYTGLRVGVDFSSDEELVKFWSCDEEEGS